MATKKRAVKRAAKKANPAYRKTTRNGIPVYVSTKTGRVVKGPAGVKKSVKKLAGAVKRTVRKAVKTGVSRVRAAIRWKTGNPKATRAPSLAVIKHYAKDMRERGLTAQRAWDWFKRVHLLRMEYADMGPVKDKFMSAWKTKNPAKRKTSTRNPSNQMVGKSKYKATMDKAKSLMPFPSTVQKGWTGDYFLMVDKKNVAMARTVLNAMAKTLAKKATKK